MRAPFQILVIPFRATLSGFEFAVLKRSDTDCWQFVAGGGEDRELPLEAAQRETSEEIGIAEKLIKLDSLATVPKVNFADVNLWGKDIYVIPEHCFAIHVGDEDISLSTEHAEFRWAPYKQVYDLLKWDSNKNALWELNQRLMKEKIPNM